MKRKTMSLKSKALVVLTLPLMMLVATTVMTARALRQSEYKDARVAHAEYVKDRINIVLNDLVDIETGVRGFLLTGEDEFLDPYWRASNDIAKDLQYLQLAVEHEGADLHLLRLRELVRVRLDILDHLRVGFDDGSLDESQTLPLLRRGRVVMEESRRLLNDMTAEQRRMIAATQEEASRTRNGAFLVAVVGAPIGMFLALAIVLGFNERTVRRLARVEGNVRRLETGEAMVAHDDADDEIGRLGRALVRSGTLAVDLQEELQRLATVDPLTSLVNRRGLMPLLEHQLEVARRHLESVAVLFADLDGLKAVNDDLGHGVGDEMLAETAAILVDSFRSSDVSARIGGDEFCVVLTAESAASTEAAIARLQRSIRTANRLPDRPYRLSLSIGVATFDPERPVSAEALIAEADERMYEHKRSKRAVEDAPSPTSQHASGVPSA
jgi:diguanylate cyclase (GGDEF)-like protein